MFFILKWVRKEAKSLALDVLISEFPPEMMVISFYRQFHLMAAEATEKEVSCTFSI